MIYKVLSHIWLDSTSKCYKKILILNNKPDNCKFSPIIKTIPRKKNSPYQDIYSCDKPPHCIHAILNPNNNSEFLGVNDIDILLNYLIENNFKIEENLTDIFMKNKLYNNNLIFVFSDKQITKLNDLNHNYITINMITILKKKTK